jgi:hypothetical protein
MPSLLAPALFSVPCSLRRWHCSPRTCFHPSAGLPPIPSCSNQLRNQGYRPSVQYITRYEFVGRAAGTAGQLRAAELPPRFRDNPHGYLRELNHVRPRCNGMDYRKQLPCRHVALPEE